MLELRALFLQRWRIHRHIADTHEKRTWSVTGHAEFVPLASSSARYFESVTLTDEARSMHATRAYRYHARASRELHIEFDDGSPFCSFVFADSRATAEHQCAQDRYRGWMELVGAQRWTTRWLIDGPDKLIEILTTYTADTRPAIER